MVSSYRRSEIVFLLSLTREQAIDLDASPRDSMAGHKSGTEALTKTAGEEHELPVLPRWREVHDARQDLERAREAVAIAQLQAGGFSEREIARLSGHERMALRRRWHVTVDEIQRKLGGDLADETPASSHIGTCIKCGLRQRVWLEEVKRKVRGGWRIVSPAKRASVCEVCLAPELADRVRPQAARAA